MRVIDHSKFTKSHEEGVLTFVAELSDLPHNWPNGLDRAYPDACDVGLIVRGKQHEVSYVVTEMSRDGEGELCAYVLEPTPDSIAKVPACAKTKVVIYND